MGRLSMLEGLSLEGNSLEGMISEAHMSNLSKLTILDFSCNSLALNLSPDWFLPFHLSFVLDFSHNNISGMVRTCLNNLSAMVQNGSSNVIIEYRIQFIDVPEFDYQDRALLKKLCLVRLYSLNLSKNNLTRSIPSKIAQLSLLNSLDSSQNQLIGKIPLSFSQLSHLGVVNLSNNNFSGKIPSNIPLQTFEASAYK
ncbi:hypothetical protein WN944_024713 [Citrus x changshan-huyou]|uniref:Uncharacterized protein n=1 Tax=Citrus x changshan-huyou TaxID=2935761 RepID=A0AAP0LUR8_9ROSI